MLHHTDALDWPGARRAKSVHAVVTDPPYGVIEYLWTSVVPTSRSSKKRLLWGSFGLLPGYVGRFNECGRLLKRVA